MAGASSSSWRRCSSSAPSGLARLEAYATLAQFREDLDTVEFLLNTQTAEPNRRREGMALAPPALGLYGAEDDPAWRDGPAVARLDAPDRARLFEDVGEVALVLARAERWRRPTGRPATERTKARRGRAPGLRPRRAMLRRRQAAEVALDPPRRAGGAARPRRTTRRTSARRPRRPRCGRPATSTAPRPTWPPPANTARPCRWPSRATRDDPRSLWSWFVLAYCHDQLDQDAEAVACYGTCIALRPEFPYSWLNRGIVQVRREQPAEAVADFDRAEALKPDWYEPPLNRAVADLAQDDAAAAIRDVGRRLGRGAPETRAYFLRASARRWPATPTGALPRPRGGPPPRADRRRRLVRPRLRPDGGRAGRGPGGLPRRPEAQPAPPLGVQNCVYLLCELKRDDEALALLDRIVALYPDFAPVRSSRGSCWRSRGTARRRSARRRSRSGATPARRTSTRSPASTRRPRGRPPTTGWRHSASSRRPFAAGSASTTCPTTTSSTRSATCPSSASCSPRPGRWSSPPRVDRRPRPRVGPGETPGPSPR